MDEKLTPPKTFVAMATMTFQYGAYFGLSIRLTGFFWQLENLRFWKDFLTIVTCSIGNSI
jgi:hypothetical protein